LVPPPVHSVRHPSTQLENLCSKHPAFAQPYASHPIADGRSFGYQDSPQIDAENGVFSH
jgi:hypothetical protein